MTRAARVRRRYRAVAAIVLNTLLLFALLQSVAAVGWWIRDRRPPAPGIYDTLDDATLATVYPDRPRDDVMALWHETVRSLAYAPFTEFAETPRRGTWVNVDAAGFRWIADQGPWPPDPTRVNVFVFGGSTTFGYGVADAETIPSRLQPLLADRGRDVRVYNFGRGYYYSTQERLLFEQLLSAGHAPAVAIFIDGLNEFCFTQDDTAVSPRLAAAFDRQEQVTFLGWLATTPVGRAVGLAQSWRTPPPSETELGAATVRHIIDRYRANKRLIEAASAAHGVTPVFVWQPVPMWHYDQQAHLFASRGYSGVAHVAGGYDAMAADVRSRPVGGDFLWLADAQVDAHEPLYVDIVHYAPRFAARIAALIAGHVGDRVAHAPQPQ